MSIAHVVYLVFITALLNIYTEKTLFFLVSDICSSRKRNLRHLKIVSFAYIKYTQTAALYLATAAAVVAASCIRCIFRSSPRATR